MRRLLAVLFLLLLLAAGGGWIWLSRPYAGFSGETFVEVPRGTSTRGVARQLAAAGVIPSRWTFLAAHFFRPDAKVQAGEYKFDHPATVWEVMNRLTRGDVYFVELRVPEGNNVFDIATLVGQSQLISAPEFLKAASDATLIRDLDPRAPSLEGYLFPATYRLTHHTTASSLLKEMTGRFRRAWNEAKQNSDADPHRTVTLASLVEKESAKPEERPKVASVFLNRLQKGMTLDCDPTTIYAALLEDRYRGTIHRSDLQNKSLYNTYQHAGLPPGPIANPGLGSLRAVLRPAQTSFLYFVAKPDHSGSHTFTSNLADHERAVQEYRHATKTTPPPHATRQPLQTRPAHPIPGANAARAD